MLLVLAKLASRSGPEAEKNEDDRRARINVCSAAERAFEISFCRHEERARKGALDSWYAMCTGSYDSQLNLRVSPGDRRSYCINIFRGQPQAIYRLRRTDQQLSLWKASNRGACSSCNPREGSPEKICTVCEEATSRSRKESGGGEESSLG